MSNGKKLDFTVILCDTYENKFFFYEETKYYVDQDIQLLVSIDVEYGSNKIGLL